MVIFSKNTEKSILSSAKRDTAVFDYMRKIEKDIENYQALYMNTGKLQNQNMRLTQRQMLTDTFENVIKKSGGEIFPMANDDTVIIFNGKAYEEILACLVKIRFVFHDDPLIKNSGDMARDNFACFYVLTEKQDEFRNKVKESAENTQDKPLISRPGSGQTSGSGFSSSFKKPRRELQPAMLAKMQKALSMMDFSSLIRRQSVCAVIGKSPPQMIFDEVFVSIADLRDMLMPDVDLTSNPWLFQYLTETLDKRVLVSVSRHDDGALTSNFSLNLNVSTILSDEFLEFDENINPSQRSTIVLELQLTDIFSDIKAFILAKTFAQYRGYKICIDGITVDKLQYIDRSHLEGDLLKIIWHPTFMDVIKEDTHFTDYVNKAERARMILCRVDDPQAVEVGNSLGINLYQGRYIQRLLAAQPRKTIFKV